MNDQDVKLLLKRELENKKVYNASWDGKCSECTEAILEGDEFWFMGNKEKVCNDCFNTILVFLE